MQKHLQVRKCTQRVDSVESVRSPFVSHTCTATSNVRFRAVVDVDIMQTRTEASAPEKSFFTELEGRGLPWKPMSRRQLKTLNRTMGRLAMRSKSAYKGQRWDVNDTTLYEHSTSYFGGRNALGPGRRTSTQAQPSA